ncbi:MAG: lipid A deacylase LpxR family protein [Verrucomicrobiota bacterium]
MAGHLAGTIIRFLFIATLGVFTANAGHPLDDYDLGPGLTFLEENDLFLKTDRHYTQGIQFSYMSADKGDTNWTAKAMDWLPAWGGLTPRAWRFGAVIGQNIYTPSDISTHTPSLGERPYAGWLYVGLALHRRGSISENWRALDALQLDVGIVGPQAFGDEAQSWVHEIRGFDQPQGWAHQLTTEPGLHLKYQRLWLRRWGTDKWAFDTIPSAGLALGNIQTAVRAGGAVRAGYNLPYDFGVQHIDSLSITSNGRSPSRANNLGFYVYGAAEGRAVAYSTFMDGNLFHASQSVERKPLAADLKAGFVLTCNWLEAGYAYIFRTREFLGQRETDGFGSVYIKLRFILPEKKRALGELHDAP